jgi:chromosome partitioning protein
MGKVVTVMNMKGGVGKTTVSANVGAACAYYRIGNVSRSVLLLDYDPQFNLTQAFLQPDTYFKLENQRKTVLGVLQDDESQLDPFSLQVPGNEKPPSVKEIVRGVQRFSDGKVLDLVPSTLDLLYLTLGGDATSLGPMERRFDRFVAACRDEYDLIFIDCHPAGSFLTKTALRNSDHVVIPVVDNAYAERGVGMMLRFIESKVVGRGRPTPHILFNLTPRTGLSATEERIRADAVLGAYCMQNRLQKFKAFSDPVGGHGFVWRSRKPWRAAALRNLLSVAKELCNRIEGGPTDGK